MKWIIPFFTALMGWTDDADTEGLVEENPLVFIIIGVVGATVATLLYVYGIEYNPGWFEGQNLVSTLGIIFLLIFIPAIAISTATGKSDLVKWEAVFLLISVGMIFFGNNWNIINAFKAKVATWMNVEWDVKALLPVILIITIILTALSAAMGKGISLGSAAIFAMCVFGIWALNSGWTWDNFFDKLGAAMHHATSGFIGEDIGSALRAAGVGAAIGVTAAALIATGVGAPIGLGILAAGAIAGGLAGFGLKLWL